MPTRVLLLRHAETAIPTVFHGAESDVGLSPRGERQAVTVAAVLAAERPAVIVSSAMRRALLTAGPIVAACGVPHRVEPALHERRVGALSGQPTSPLPAPWAETFQRWIAGDTAAAAPGAESFDAIRDRVLPVWERLAAAYAGQTYAVVIHGAVIRVLLLSLGVGLGPADWHKVHTPNVGIAELWHAAAGWRLVHLPEVPAAVRAVE